MNLETLKTYSEQIHNIASANHISDIKVFGSVVCGNENNDSDIDFLVTLDDKASLMDLGGASNSLENLLGCKVDIVPDESLHWYIKDRVLLEAVSL